MPSRYEPCGLNQLYSLRVRDCTDLSPQPVDWPTRLSTATRLQLHPVRQTGFYIDPATEVGLDSAIGRALHMRYHDPESWARLVQSGMSQDWSWRNSASQYIDLYDQTISLKRQSSNK